MRPTYPRRVRVAHWLNAAVLVALAMSGLQIFDAHPVLYAADASDPERVVLTLPGAVMGPDGRTHGEMTVLGRKLDTGAFTMDGVPAGVRLGGWLEGGRRIHFAMAWLFGLNGLLYLVAMRRRRRAVWPGPADVRALPGALRDHLRLPPRLGAPDGGLNPLQKVAYAGVALVLGPMIVATGLAMSPQWDAVVPGWTDLFGGRQFARTWHFVAMAGFGGFVVVHLVMVALAGPRDWMKMITGRSPAPARVPVPASEAPDAP